MATAAFNKTIQLSVDGGSTFHEIKGLNDASISFGGDILDSTAFDNIVNGTRSKFYGLRDASVSLSGDFLAGTTDYQIQFIHKWLRNVTGETYDENFQIKYFPEGDSVSVSFTMKVVIESIEISGSVDGKEEISISLQSTEGITIDLTA